MEDLSIVQEFVLCTLTDKGRLPVLNMEAPVCVLAGGLIELLLSGSISVDEKNKVYVSGDLNESQTHLKSLFDRLYECGPRKIERIVQDYNLGLSDRRLNALLTDIGNAIVAKGCAVQSTRGIFGDKYCFIPDKAEADKVIQKIRAELLESGDVSEETVTLVSLMEKSGQIKKYFSRYESEQLKSRLKEIRKSPSSQLVKQMVDYVDMMIAVIASVSATTSVN